MELTEKQKQGLKIATERYFFREKCTVISGYAGSGKSTLVKFIINALQVPEEQVCYACYTGKAAQVLLKKGNKNVCTLHRLLYTSYPLPNGKFRRVPKITLEPYKIIIVDEVSMAPMELMKLLLSHRDIYVICLGDPFQLPPVDKNQDNHLLDNPHIFLDEIMRQAQESEIIRVSMAVREGRPLPQLDGEEVKILNKGDLNEGMLLWADQVLCATNATRVALNKQMRDLLGRTGGPQEGDKVICLRNYWDDCASNEDPLVNGTIGYLKNTYSSFNQVPAYLGGYRFDTTSGDFVSDSGSHFSNLEMDTKMILTGEKCCDWKVAYSLGKNAKTAHLVPKEFTYGYAITTHKSQGSEWDKVLVVEEAFPFPREEHARWLYTAVTRAAEKLVLVKK